MKLHFCNIPNAKRLPGKPTSGVALVIVLAFLVIITGLVLAFFSSVTTEISGANTSANEASTKQLADSTVQAAIGAIRQATSGTTAWASQPGMIRTYDNSGSAVAYYKLYSSDSMVVTGASLASFDPAGDVDPQWNTKPALFTDLNSPVVSGTAVVFPIVDGNAIKLLTLTPSGSSVAAYLGYDANNDGLPDVEGFSVDPSKVSYTVGNPLSLTNTPVPMPTKWIYVLRDGTLTAPDTTSGTVATFANAPTAKQPTSSNPISGRIAFWTDDETCKININTASEGTYTDAPRTESIEDYFNLAVNQPVNKEYQRYPGHPAMTSLSTVFGSFSNPENIYSIIPRIGTGGSKEGTVLTTGTAASATFALTLNANRLYSSIDELLFQPISSGTTRQLNSALVSGSNQLDPVALKKMKFFITANSRAPDVNLFGLPRVCIWPISAISGTATRTTYDSTIAFCSTLRNDLASSGSSPYLYYFQRLDPTTSGTDLPAAIPTVSGTDLSRNRTLVEYLRALTNKNIPGFGGSFGSKYNATDVDGILPGTTTERDQILTEIFDYIRCTDLVDGSVGIPYTGGTSNPFNSSGQVVPIVDQNTMTRGFGRFDSVQGGYFLFIAHADNNNQPPAPEPQVSGSTVRIQTAFLPQLFCPSVGVAGLNPYYKIKITGLDQFTYNGTSMGFESPIVVEVKSTNLALDRTAVGDQEGFSSTLKVIGSPTGRILPISNTVDVPKPAGWSNATRGSVLFNTTGSGMVTMEIQDESSGTTVQTAYLQFPTGNIPLPYLTGSTTGDFSVTSGSGTTSYHYDYRSFTKATTSDSSNGNAVSNPNGSNARYEGGVTTKWNQGSQWISNLDVIRGVSVSHGDVRMMAARSTLPKPGTTGYPYAPVNYASYFNASVPTLTMHNLWNNNGSPYLGATLGRLVQNINYDYQINALEFTWAPNNVKYASANPGADIQLHYSDIPYGINGVAAGGTNSYNAATDAPGDWDNGIVDLRDGPFINKPDEGDKGRSVSSTISPPYFAWTQKVGQQLVQTSLFSPNRQIPSAVTFGSLPTGVLENQPWKTLLFRPGPDKHPGLGKPIAGQPPYTSPPDHLLLDLFSMPVVEPYPISEPLSTAGKINMNYKIAPFAYINRDTGIRAILKSEKVIAISGTTAAYYKFHGGGYPQNQNFSMRFPVNADETLLGFTDRFNRNDLFRSATEICDLDIAPTNITGIPHTSRATLHADMETYWKSANPLTGDNSRERPYATIYPRLTTKSNTFTVHFRVQTLKKSNATTAIKWDETKDMVIGEYRGSQIIERYVDPSDSTLPDFALPSNLQNNYSLDSYPDANGKLISAYKFRVLSTKKFEP